MKLIKKKTKRLFKIMIMISFVLAIYISVKRSAVSGWYTCMSFSKGYSCNLIEWLMQMILLAIIIFIILFVILFGIKVLFKKRKTKQIKEKKLWKKIVIRKALEQTKEEEIEKKKKEKKEQEEEIEIPERLKRKKEVIKI